MRLIQFHIGGDEWFINPDNILHVHSSTVNNTCISLVDESYINVDESLKTVVARIGNDELNVAYDCMREVERLKQKIKTLQTNTQPSEI